VELAGNLSTVMSAFKAYLVAKSPIVRQLRNLLGTNLYYTDQMTWLYSQTAFIITSFPVHAAERDYRTDTA
jgi:hypothetical protein